MRHTLYLQHQSELRGQFLGRSIFIRDKLRGVSPSIASWRVPGQAPPRVAQAWWSGFWAGSKFGTGWAAVDRRG